MMADYAARETDKEIAKLERKIAKLYREAQKDIEAKTKDFWERHEVKNAKYQEQLKEGKITEDDYQSWLRGQVFQGKQWAAKREQIEQILTDTNKQAVNIINGGRIGVFATNSNWQAYQIEHEIGLNFGFGIYDADAVTRLLRDDPNLLPPKKLSVSKDKKWNKGNINRQISQGIIQGESLDKIAKRLQTVTTMNRNQSLTNARTMMTGAQNAGRLESMKRAQDMDIKVKKKWLATLDGHTRRSHRRLDGQTVDIDEPFRVGGYSIEYPGDSSARPEMVYNCRCTMTSEIEDFPNEGERYDNIAGKPIKNMTYTEWMKAKENSDNFILDYSKKFIKNLSDNDISRLREYTGYSYSAVNNYMRGDERFNVPDVVDLAEDISDILSRTNIPSTITLHRGTDLKELVQSAFPDVTRVSRYEKFDKLKAAIGKEFVNKGFMSTSTGELQEQYNKGVEYIINAPQGTKGLHISFISKQKSENEFLLGNGQIFVIDNIECEVDEEGYVVGTIKVYLSMR